MRFHRYRIQHTTTYRYSNVVSEGVHLIKLKPRPFHSQHCLDFEMEIQPDGEQRHAFSDYFGNHCTHVILGTPHEQLTVTSRCRVAVGLPFWPEPGETASWEVVKGQAISDRGAQSLEALEFTYDSPMIRVDASIAAFARPSFTPGRPILEAGLDLTRRIFEAFEFDPSATEVATPVHEVLERRRGVCQDFAHLGIACFRSLGLPARYISGYLETDPPPGAQKLVGVDASHAWLAFYCPGIGWIELDPTNGCIPSMRHIKIGYGRDYSDIAPLIGIIKGPDQHDLEVSVDVAAEGENQPESPEALSGDPHRN